MDSKNHKSRACKRGGVNSKPRDMNRVMAEVSEKTLAKKEGSEGRPPGVTSGQK